MVRMDGLVVGITELRYCRDGVGGCRYPVSRDADVRRQVQKRQRAGDLTLTADLP